MLILTVSRLYWNGKIYVFFFYFVAKVGEMKKKKKKKNQLPFYPTTDLSLFYLMMVYHWEKRWYQQGFQS